jgi:RNA polymerase sigma-70 factor, ECF subfamily
LPPIIRDVEPVFQEAYHTARQKRGARASEASATPGPTFKRRLLKTLLTADATESLKSNTMERTDEALVVAARAGSAGAFRELVEIHSGGVFRLAYRITGNEQDAEDAVQESFLRAYRQIGKFEGSSDFGTWLYRIATNCALDTIRVRGRQPVAENPLREEPSGGPTPEREVLSGEIRERMELALSELSPVERAAFVLRHFEGMRIEDIGQALGCQPGAARHSVFRAVRKLRKAMEPLASGVLRQAK